MLQRLLRGDGIDPDTQKSLAFDAGITPLRIDEIATFLNQWDKDPEEDEKG